MPRQRQSQPNQPTKNSNATNEQTKKSNAVVGVQEIGDEIAITEESSWPKRKSTSTSGERKASKGKKPEGKLTLVGAIL